MNFEGKNLWNYSNKMFRFQRVSGIHICLFCFCCGIFVHRCCSSPTCAECDGAAFPKQGPLYSGSQGCGTREARLLLLPASSTDRSRTTATSLHSDANWDPLLSLPLLCLDFSLCSCLLSAEPSLYTAGLALAHSPASRALQAGNKLNLQPLTTSPIHVHSSPLWESWAAPSGQPSAHFTILKSHQASTENLAL